MALKKFHSEKDVIDYADGFLRDHVRRFRKDMSICLAGYRVQNRLTHAYFPALMTCIALTDLLSGLYCGTLNYPKLKDLQNYREKFLSTYDDETLAILYCGFRHKIAHIAHPYAVFDTSTSKDLKSKPQKKIAWTILETNRHPAIELIRVPSGKKLEKTRTPWLVPYDHRLKVRLKTLEVDIINSVFGPTGYLNALGGDHGLQQKFESCMMQYYPD